MPLTIKELAAAVGAEVVYGSNDPAAADATVISSAASLDEAQPGQLSFISNPKYARLIETTRASAVIVSAGFPKAKTADNTGLVLLKSKDPYFAFQQAVVKLHGYRRHPHAGVHPAAHVEPSATVGEGTVIYPGAYVGADCRIGRDCILYPNAVLYEGCILGDRVIIHAGASIGCDGFGFATHKGADGVAVHHKIPQIGNVVIEDDVEIGANTSIDRAALGSTLIGRGTKIDDNVAIGHGAHIGPHGLLVALVGVAGSATLGHHVTLAGQVGVAGHLKIGDGVTVGAQGGIMSDVPDQVTLIGSPAMPAMQARRVYSIFTQLPELVERVKQLEDKVGELSDTGTGTVE